MNGNLLGAWAHFSLSTQAGEAGWTEGQMHASVLVFLLRAPWLPIEWGLVALWAGFGRLLSLARTGCSQGTGPGVLQAPGLVGFIPGLLTGPGQTERPGVPTGPGQMGDTPSASLRWLFYLQCGQ